MEGKDHYLKQDLYHRFQTDPQVLDWIEQGSLDGIWFWDIERPEHEWYSPAFKRTFGYEEDEIPPSSAWWQENIFPEDLKTALENFHKHVEDPEHPYDQIVRYRHKDGGTVWIRCRGLVIRDASGKPTRMLGAHTNVTNIVRAEQKHEGVSAELERITKWHKLALRASRVGLWAWDVVENQLTWSEEMYKLYGVNADDFSGAYEAWVKGLHPEDRDRGQQDVEAALSGEKKFDTEFRVIWPNGEIHYIRAIADTFMDDNGRPRHMLGVNWDITEEKRQRSLLEFKQAELARSNRDLEQFAFIASHDLQEPLRKIKAFGELLVKEYGSKLDEEGRYYVERMSRASERMEMLIHSILKLSRVSGKTVNRKPVNLHRLLQNMTSEERYPAEFSIAALPAVWGDEIQLRQVFQNLINNSLKFKKSDQPCEITISQGKGKQSKKGEWLHEIVFSDNGIGFDSDHGEKIFKIFERLHTRSDFPGTGIGLSICQKIIERQGGEIVAEGRPGKGATFRMFLPEENLS
jgi:PAS domain S-box-containing protein